MHIVARAEAARARSAERRQATVARVAPVTAVATPSPQPGPVVLTPPLASVSETPPVGSAPLPEAPVEAPSRPAVRPARRRRTSVPSIAWRPSAPLSPPASTTATRAAPAALRPRRFAEIAAALVLMPPAVVAAGLFIRDVIVAPEAPPVVAMAPVAPAVVERRLADMLRTPTLPTRAPAITSPGRIEFAALHLPTAAPQVAVPPPAGAGTSVFAALSYPTTAPPVPPAMTPTLAALQLPPLALPGTPPAIPFEDTATLAHAHQCEPEPARTADTTPVDADTFGTALAAAAIDQMRDLAIYNAKYTRIAYPGGDVPAFFGVCTDVVIRAYRRLGIDLQVEVQKARVGRGDPSIDHRRTETLRTFLARHGESLPVSEFAEDYLPGDIVTYYRPQNRSSTAHIAIVTDRFAPSGRPMIVHNRGFGVQLEDALFVDKITGHYRYRGPAKAAPALIAATPPRGVTPGLAESPRGAGAVVRGQGRATLAKAAPAGALAQQR